MTISHRLAYRAARRAVRPKDTLTVSEWADANRVLSGEATLKQDIHAALSEMEREFTKRLNLIGAEE